MKNKREYKEGHKYSININFCSHKFSSLQIFGLRQKLSKWSTGKIETIIICNVRFIMSIIFLYLTILTTFTVLSNYVNTIQVPQLTCTPSDVVHLFGLLPQASPWNHVYSFGFWYTLPSPTGIFVHSQ